jgi:mono/diheme cytochrome c family protein
VGRTSQTEKPKVGSQQNEVWFGAEQAGVLNMLRQRFVGGGILVGLLVGVLMSGRHDQGAFAQDANPRRAENRGKPRPGTEHYQKYCQVCHGADGRGTDMKQAMPTIPDFTRATWQEGRTNAELLVSILEGKGPQMPGFNDRLTEEQCGDLVTLVRAFNRSATTPQP